MRRLRKAARKQYERVLGVFLTQVKRDGGLAGSSPAYVKGLPRVYVSGGTNCGSLYKQCWICPDQVVLGKRLSKFRIAKSLPGQGIRLVAGLNLCHGKNNLAAK